MSDSCIALTKLFPHRVCINLDRRPERWERMQARFAAAAVGAVERFPAVDGGAGGVPASWPYSSGAYGCLRSHLAVVRAAPISWGMVFPFLEIWVDSRSAIGGTVAVVG